MLIDKKVLITILPAYIMVIMVAIFVYLMGSSYPKYDPQDYITVQQHNCMVRQSISNVISLIPSKHLYNFNTKIPTYIESKNILRARANDGVVVSIGVFDNMGNFTVFKKEI